MSGQASQPFLPQWAYLRVFSVCHPVMKKHGGEGTCTDGQCIEVCQEGSAVHGGQSSLSPLPTVRVSVSLVG